jgi:Tol biopolymer transport system component
MNGYTSDFLSFRRWASIFGGLLLVVCGGFYFVNISAKTENLTEQNLVLGRLAYATVIGTFSGAQFVINSANADGTGGVGLTSFPPNASDPAWSPDGTKIVYVTNSSSADIYVMNANGTNQTNLSNTMSANELNPSWSATGKIVYERDNQIWTMNADGTNRQQFQAVRSSPTYSPDGTKVAHVCCFFSGGPNPNGIFSITVGGGSTQITTGNFDDFPAWQPVSVPRRTPFDFDGDGRSNVSVFRPSEGVWYLLRSMQGFAGVQFGSKGDIPIPNSFVR